MNLSELKELIITHNIPDKWYSIDEGLKPDALILYKNYSSWEFFYLSEKGERNDYKAFERETDAYQFLWNRLKRQADMFLKK